MDESPLDELDDELSLSLLLLDELDEDDDELSLLDELDDLLYLYNCMTFTNAYDFNRFQIKFVRYLPFLMFSL